MAVPKFEDFKAPWEVDANGAEIPEDKQELDGSKLKRHLYNLLSDKEKLQGTVATVLAERDEFKTKVDEAARAGETEADKTKREIAELQKKVAAADKTEADARRLRIALRKGLTEIQAKRLVGETEEELEKDAEDLVSSFGGKGEEQEAGGEVVKRTPKRLHANSKTDDDSGPDLAYSKEKLAELFPL
jgi:transposase